MALGTLAVFAAVAFYGRAWPEAPVIVSDSRGYMAAAEDLGDGRLDELHDRTPGYPLLLLACGASAAPSRQLFYVQLLLHFASTFLLLRVLRAAGVRGWILAVFVVVAGSPQYVAPSALVLTEIATEFLLAALVAAVVAWIRSGRVASAVAIGIVLVLAGFVRPTFVVLFVPVAVLLVLLAAWLRQPRRRHAYTVACGLVLPAAFLAGWVAHNGRQFDYLGVTPLLGFNLSTRTVRFVERLPDEYGPVRDILVDARNRELVHDDPAHLGHMYIWRARSDLQRATGLSMPALSRYMLQLNLKLIRLAPLEYLREVSMAACSYWFPATPEIAVAGVRWRQLAAALLHFSILLAFFMALMFLVGVAVAAVLRPGGRATARAFLADRAAALAGTSVALAVIFYTLVISTWLEIGSPRYRAPTDLLILCVTAIGIDSMCRTYLESRRAGSASAAAAAGHAPASMRVGSP